VLREIEGHGPTRAAAEGVVTLAVLAGSGALVGSLAARARRQRERYETLRAVQRALAEPTPLGRVAARLAAVLTRRLGVDAAGLVLDEGRIVVGADRLDPRSLTARVLARREPEFVTDAGTDARARRVVVVPLASDGETVGALAVERLGDVSREERDALVGFGAAVGVAVDNARLAPPVRRAVPDPAPLIAAAVELFRRTRTTHRLELHVEGALPRVDADADALDRVLKNLISNALKYSPPGSCVRVRARATDGVVAVDVEDEGPGIPAEERARVFEPYYRVRETAGLGPGTGLGLSVVKSLVEAHGGTVRADAAPGCGTRMTVMLPALP